MPIVSSITADVSTQRDGRRWVMELHTDQVDKKYSRVWLAEAADDLVAALAVYAGHLSSGVAAQEIATNVRQVTANGSLAVLSFVYSTAGQGQAALRTAYLTATRVEAIMIGDFLSSLSNATLQSLFSMTSGQVNTLRTNKLTPAASAATTIRAAAGA